MGTSTRSSHGHVLHNPECTVDLSKTRQRAHPAIPMRSMAYSVHSFLLERLGAEPQARVYCTLASRPSVWFHRKRPSTSTVWPPSRVAASPTAAPPRRLPPRPARRRLVVADGAPRFAVGQVSVSGGGSLQRRGGGNSNNVCGTPMRQGRAVAPAPRHTRAGGAPLPRTCRTPCRGACGAADGHGGGCRCLHKGVSQGGPACARPPLRVTRSPVACEPLL